MTREEIMTRCRKVAIKIEGNRIFGDQHSPYDFVPAFRDRQLAEKNLHSIVGTASLRPYSVSTVCEFYLVPASRIDGTQDRTKN